MKKLSIIIPCYKTEKYLSKCLDSLFNQTLEDIEIICINDGSPDNSLDILKDYKKIYKDKLIVINKKNEGVWRARKDGIKKATGEFIGFIDSDDYVNSNYAEKLYNSAKQKKSDIAVCGFDRIDLDTGKLYSREMCKSDKKIINMKKNPEEIITLNGAVWNKIFRSELLKNMGDLEEPPKILEDLMFFLLASLEAKKISFVSESLIYYMVRSNSTINTINEKLIKSTYDAMLQVKKIYLENRHADKVEILDTIAFLHLGISLIFRLSYDKNCNLNLAIQNNTKFLDENFSSWRKSPYIKLSYMLKKGFWPFKLWVVKQFYRFNAFKLFLKCYRFMIDKLKVDIKW